MEERRTVTIDVVDLKEALRTSVYLGCKDFVEDPKVRQELGRAFYDALVEQGAKDTKLWVGGKVLAAIGIMLISFGMTLYVSSGAGK